MIDIEITNEQRHVAIDRRRLRALVERIAADAGYRQGTIGVAVVDDQRIAELHGRYLNDPTPTDTMSWVLERREDYLEGEVIASGETAARRAAEFNQTPDDELALYVIHGTLHLVGHDDGRPEEAAQMRALERRYL